MTTKQERNQLRREDAAAKLQDAFHHAGSLCGERLACANSDNATLRGRLDRYAAAVECYFDAFDLLDPSHDYAPTMSAGDLADEDQLRHEARKLLDAVCAFAAKHGIDPYEGTLTP